MPFTAFEIGSAPPNPYIGQEAYFVTVAATGGTFIGPTLAPIWSSFTFCSKGTVGTPYSQDFDLYPALPPTTFTVVSGSLPTGLALSNVSGDVGRLSGTPTVAGTYSFTLRATNAYGTADKAFSVTVIAAASGNLPMVWVSVG